MWFGTMSYGLWMYNPKRHEFQNFTKEDGVKSDNIWITYRAKKGELLFAGESSGAVYKFNGKTLA